MPKVGIIYNDTKPLACRLADEIQEKLVSRGWEVALATGVGGILGYARAGEAQPLKRIEEIVPKGFDDAMAFGIVLGGDGTVLAGFRQAGPCGIPLLTVNTGHMGFLTEAFTPQLPQALDCILEGQHSVEERAMFSVRVYRNEELLWEALSLNEVVLHREPMTSMCHFEVQVGDHAPVDIAADGIIISTPTGSTAYALSSGGPVVTPDVPILQLVPICPHSLASRALVFSDTNPVKVHSAMPNPLVMVVDGNGGCEILPGDRVCVEKSPYPARFIRLKRPEFFRILREKLGWGLPHIAKPTSVELPS